MYDNAARAVLTQLRRIPKGDTIEEDHQRGRALIANYVKDKTGAIEQIDRDRKTYVRVTDYQKMRQGVGMLLAELMRIKAEGDYAAIKALIDRYGVHFDPKLRDQVVERYTQLNLPTYWAGVNPELTADARRKGQRHARHDCLSSRCRAPVLAVWRDVGEIGRAGLAGLAGRREETNVIANPYAVHSGTRDPPRGNRVDGAGTASARRAHRPAR